jgi:hypothetical protein
VQERTSELQAANKELEAFPIRCRMTCAHRYERWMDMRKCSKRITAASLTRGNRLLGAVRSNSRKMGQLIDDLLAFSRLGRTPLKTQAGGNGAPRASQILEECELHPYTERPPHRIRDRVAPGSVDGRSLGALQAPR